VRRPPHCQPNPSIRDLLAYAGFESFSKLRDPRALSINTAPGRLACLPEADDARRILCAAAATSFLAGPYSHITFSIMHLPGVWNEGNGMPPKLAFQANNSIACRKIIDYLISKVYTAIG
jgi:hypothetical protein